MRLLLVEDNERFAVLLKRGLATAGFVVDVLPTAEDAAAALRASRFDVVVLDLGLPDADGLDLLGAMRRRQDATPVLILTARGSLEDRVVGLQSGADDYLVKPFALEELVARLHALLRRPGNLLGATLSSATSLSIPRRAKYLSATSRSSSRRERSRCSSNYCAVADGWLPKPCSQTISTGYPRKSGRTR